MNGYFLISFSAVLLALDFILQKKYQHKNGVSTAAGLTYNAFLGLITATVFWGINGFRFHFSVFSVIVAFGMSVLGVTYSLIGFQILKSGSVAHYTLFLMTGGMCVPYVWGLLFLNESISLMRIIGLLLIIGAVVLSNTGDGRSGAKQLLLCTAVFLLNGFVSVLSKLHQVETVHAAVSVTEFVALTGIAKFILCTLVLMVIKTKSADAIRLPSIGRSIPIIGASAVVGGVSYLCQLISAESLPASVMYPFVTGGSIIFTALAGWLVFRERPRRLQWIGIAICFIGTCLFL